MTVTTSRHRTVNMLYVIGLGLSDEKDITVKGLEASQALHGLL